MTMGELGATMRETAKGKKKPEREAR